MFWLVGLKKFLAPPLLLILMEVRGRLWGKVGSGYARPNGVLAVGNGVIMVILQGQDMLFRGCKLPLLPPFHPPPHYLFHLLPYSAISTCMTFFIFWNYKLFLLFVFFMYKFFFSITFFWIFFLRFWIMVQ